MSKTILAGPESVVVRRDKPISTVPHAITTGVVLDAPTLSTVREGDEVWFHAAHAVRLSHPDLYQAARCVYVYAVPRSTILAGVREESSDG